jgi:hypothetical protein
LNELGGLFCHEVVTGSKIQFKAKRKM